MTEKNNRPGAAKQPGQHVTNSEKSNTAFPDPCQFRDAARAYLARGWAPIPIAGAEPGNKDTGKAPVLKGWETYCPPCEKIAALWPDGHRRNLGISCGPSRLVVLDFDAPDAYPIWAAAHPEAARSYTVARDNAEPGRCHVYFIMGDEQDAPAQLTKTATGWGDLKSEGGQVVAPPSVHYTGGAYRVVQDAEPLPWRDEYTPEVYAPGLPERKTRTPATAPAPAPRPDAKGRGIPPSVADLLAAGAPEGTRNQTAFHIATQLRDEGYSEAEALDLLERFGARCTPPMDTEELRATVKSSYKAAPRPPATDPQAAAFYGKGNATQETAEPPAPDSWPEPQPISALGEAPPPWPWEVYPPTLRDIGKAISETMNVPAELPGLGLLCAASIAARNVARVEIKRGHYQYPNLYGMAAAPVYVGKTPVARVIQAPLLDFQKEQSEHYKSDLAKWAAEAKAARAQAVGIERKLARGDGDTAELTRELERLAAIENAKPTPPAFIVNDCTPERMASLMHFNGGRLGVFTSEARQVLSIARGRYSNQGSDIQLWLAGHGGDYLRYDRNASDKPPFEIHHPTLAAFLATQPDSLRTLGASAELRESGFLARWLYVVPETNGQNEYPVESISLEILSEYDLMMRGVLGMQYDADAEGDPRPHLCRMTPGAFTLWKKYHDTIKADAREAAPLLAQCLGKMPEHLARIALVFHLVGCAEAGNMPGAIAEEYVERAYTLGVALLAHIRRAVALMGETTERNQARELWPVLDAHRPKLREMRTAEKLGDVEAVKPRDVARYSWAGIEDTDAARAALDVLEVKGWLRSATVHGKVRAAPAHELYYLHPKGAA